MRLWFEHKVKETFKLTARQAKNKTSNPAWAIIGARRPKKGLLNNASRNVRYDNKNWTNTHLCWLAITMQTKWNFLTTQEMGGKFTHERLCSCDEFSTHSIVLFSTRSIYQWAAGVVNVTKRNDLCVLWLRNLVLCTIYDTATEHYKI